MKGWRDLKSDLKLLGILFIGFGLAKLVFYSIKILKSTKEI